MARLLVGTRFVEQRRVDETGTERTTARPLRPGILVLFPVVLRRRQRQVADIGLRQPGQHRVAEGRKRLLDLNIAVDALEHPFAAEFRDTLVEPAAEAAEARIVAVAEGENREAHASQRPARRGLQSIGEAHRGIGRVAFPVRAGDHGEL
jgi:hypothetical protein